MIIREYIDTDKDAVLELLRLNTPAYFSPEEEKDFIGYLADEIEKYYVVELDGTIVACAGFNLSEDKTVAMLSWDMVHPEYQGKGVGFALTKFRIERMKEIEGVKTISVRTSQFVYPFYEKFGLILREVKKDYWAEGYDMYRLNNDVELV